MHYLVILYTHVIDSISVLKSLRAGLKDAAKIELLNKYICTSRK